MRSALANTAGISDLKVPGQESRNPEVKKQGQVIQYTGSAKPEEVIAILQKNIFFKVKVAKGPKPGIKGDGQDGPDQPTTGVDSKSEDGGKPKPDSESRSQ